MATAEVKNASEEVLAWVEEAQTEQQRMLEMLRSDPLLRDVAPDASLVDVDALMARERGQALMVYIRRFDGEDVEVMLAQHATVKDLKKRFQAITLQREAAVQGVASLRLNWRWVWKAFSLVGPNKTVMSDGSVRLIDLGIRSGDVITFTRNIRERFRTTRRQGRRFFRR